MSTPDISKRSRFRRALGRVGAGALLLVTFSGASVVAAVVHLGTKPARRIAAQTLNDVLHSSLAGEVHIDGLRRLGPFRISIDDVTVNNPGGGRALWLHGIDARLNAFAIARSALLGKKALEITVHALSIDHAEVVTEQGPSTALTLQESFQPRDFGPPKPEDPRARPLELKLASMRLGSAWIHGVIAEPNAIDADLRGLAGRFALLPDGIELGLEPTEIEERRALPVKVKGTAKGRYEAHGDTTVAGGGFQGTVGETGVALEGLMDGDRVTATVDVPRVVPEALKPFVAEPPLTRPVGLQVRADGTLPVISVEARLAEVDAPARAVVVESALDVAAPLRAAVDVGIHGMDPSLFAAKAMAASIDARVTARVALAGGSPSVVADVHTEPTEMAGQVVPAVDAHVDFAGGRLAGTLAVAEDGAPVTGTFAMTTEDQRARFEVLGAVPALHAAPRIANLVGGAVDGSVALKVQGSYEGGRLDARADTTFSVQKGKTDVALRHGELHARAHGPVDGLTVQVALDGDGLNAYGHAFDRVSARVEGPVKAPRVQAQLASADRFIGVSAEVDAEAQAARRIRLDLRHGANAARASVESVGKSGEVLRVAGLSFEGDGVGSIHGSLAMDPRGVTGKVHGEALDIARIVDLAALPMDVRGLASFDVALARGRRGPEGHVALELEDGAYGDTQGMSAHLTTTLEGDDVRADGYVRLIAPRPTAEGKEGERRLGAREGGPALVQAALTRKGPEAEVLARRAVETCGGPIAKLQIENGRAKIHGAITDARTWEGLRGETTIRAEDLDLRCLKNAALVKLPDSIEDISGTLSAKLRVVRDGASALPSVRDVSLATRGLAVRGPKDPDTGATSWESRALDVAINADFDAQTGRAQGDVTVHDERVLLDLSAATTVDVPALLDPERRKRAIEALPIAAHLAIPRRALKDFRSLPSMVRDQIPPVSGQIQLDVYAAGSVHEPRVAVRAMGFKLRDASTVDEDGGPLADYDFPLDLDASVFYDSHAGDASVFVTHEHAELARLTAKAKADLNAVLDAKPGAAIPWKGGMKATLTDLPLGKMPYIAERKVGGVLRGEVNIEGLNEKPQIAVDLQAYDMRMGPDMFLEKANIALHVGPQKGEGDKAVLKADLLAQDGGTLTAAANLGIAWKNGAVPMVEPKRGADASVEAKRFRLSVAQPFLSDTLSKLDGYLDGRLALNWAHIGEAQNAQMSGQLKLTDGVIEIPTMGQEIRDASLTIVAEPSGTIRIDDMKAQGRSGGFHGSASASIAGGELKNAHAELEIPNGEDLPITLEGVPFGMANGKVSVDAQNKGKELAVAVKIPNFHLALPSSIGKSVQPLKPNEDIAISPRLVPPEEKLAKKDAGAEEAKSTPIVIGVDLGDIHIEGQGVDATLTDSAKVPLRIVIDEDTKVGGDIRITRGKVEVLGKVFEIEQGSLVHLRPEDTSNPFMNVTASWNSPDGTRVYIDYIGNLEPITHEKIKFRSDPPKSQQEVVNLLLFGPEHEQGTVAGGASAGPSQNASQTASNLAAAGGSSLASSQINQVLSGIGPLQGLEVKLGTDDAGALRTSLGYKLGRNVTATASFGGSGSAASGSSVVNSNSPEATNATEFGLEWRFKPHWSLRASVGTGAWTSTGLDVLWTRRY